MDVAANLYIPHRQPDALFWQVFYFYRPVSDLSDTREVKVDRSVHLLYNVKTNVLSGNAYILTIYDVLILSQACIVVSYNYEIQDFTLNQ